MARKRLSVRGTPGLALLAAGAALLLTIASAFPSAERGAQLTAPPEGEKGLVMVENPAPGEGQPAQVEQGPSIELQTGQQYAAGTRVESSADGVSFTIPEEWLGGLRPGAAAFLFGSNSRPGLGMIIMRPATTWQEIELFLGRPQDLGGGVVLSPSSPGQRTSRGYEISLANSMYAGHAIGRMGDRGNGVIVFFGGPAGERDYYAQLAASTAESVAFAAPRLSAATQQWHAYLAGMMLKRSSSYYSGGTNGSYVGGSSSQSLHLCSDGSYAYISSTSVAADAGSGTSGYGGGDGAELGQWSVETTGDRVLLNLRPVNGGVSQHTLSVQGDKTYVDGERALRVQSDRCR